jgi:NADH-quinone oxidoreductase subunit N
MAIFLFSLAGLPPTAGFIGKFYLFSSAIKGGFIWLAVIGVLNSVMSVYYYLRVIVFMYMKEPEEEFDWVTITPPVILALAIGVAGVLVPGVVPGHLLSLAQSALQ